jgi:antitoxin component YwqK of YwqJK toxin-antitoxin module
MSNSTDPFYGDTDFRTSDKKNKIVKTYDSNMNLTGLYEEYDNQGRLIRRSYYQNNKLHGPNMRRIFNNTNILQIVKNSYDTGVLNGPYVNQNYNNNKLISQTKSDYLAGKLNGIFEEKNYDQNGDVLYYSYKEYVDDVLNGPARESRTHKITESTYIAGELDGVVTHFMKDGNLQKYSLLYNNGIFQEVVEAIDINNRNLILEDGIITVYKACETLDGVPVIVKLRVHQESLRTKIIAETDYQRISSALVEEIKDLSGSILDTSGNPYTTCVSFMTESAPITYTLNSEVSITDMEESIFVKTGAGIYVHKYNDMAEQWFN